jgi:ParB/RepB/Spo0J family partition protein
MELMQDRVLKIEDIYVPVKRRKSLDPTRVAELADSILESGQKTPIQVRPDDKGYVLVEGLHRLEACKALGETTIVALVVQARRK